MSNRRREIQKFYRDINSYYFHSPHIKFGIELENRLHFIYKRKKTCSSGAEQTNDVARERERLDVNNIY